MEAVRRKYEGRIAAAKEAFHREAQRVRTVPGGMMALMALEGPATQLAALEAGAGGPGLGGPSL